MYCKYCGTKIDNDSAFCRYCGKFQDFAETGNSQKSTKSSDNKQDSRPIRVEFVKPSIITEDKARKGVKTIIKEIALIALFIGIAFLGKLIAFKINNSSQYPKVTQEEQKAFNDAIFKKQYPNGLPPLEEYVKGNWDESKYPEVSDINFGLAAAEYLRFGEFKYDKEATSLSQLEDINQFRKDSLYLHASYTADIVFWILLIGLPLIRYFSLFVRWLF